MYFFPLRQFFLYLFFLLQKFLQCSLTIIHIILFILCYFLLSFSFCDCLLSWSWSWSWSWSLFLFLFLYLFVFLLFLLLWEFWLTWWFR
jgi:hypothetical protein